MPIRPARTKFAPATSRRDIPAEDDGDQKNNAANREGLKREGRAAEQDGEEAKDLEQTGHECRSGRRDSKRDFAAGDVTVRGQHLPAEAVCPGGQAGGLAREGIRGSLLAEFERLRGAVRTDERHARAERIDAYIEAQLDRNIGSRYRALQRRV